MSTDRQRGEPPLVNNRSGELVRRLRTYTSGLATGGSRGERHDNDT